MQAFTIGDEVMWASSGTTKIGKIVAVVPAGEPVWTAERRLALGDGPGLTDVGSPRSHESYIVQVGRKLYWPRVSKLFQPAPLKSERSW